MKPQKRKILIVENDQAIADALKELCLAAGYQAKTLSDGAAAQNAIGLEKYDLIISAVLIPKVNGIELLHFVRKEHSIPVVLMAATGDLTSNSDAKELGAAGVLSKPLKKEQILDLIGNLLKENESEIEAPKSADADKDFIAVAIDEFVSGSELQCDIYIRLSAEKYVKVASRGQRVEIPRITQYKHKGVTKLFLTKSDFANYIGFNLNLAKTVANAKNLAHEKKVRYIMNATSTILQQFHVEGITRENYEYGVQMVETAVNVATQSNSLLAIIDSLKEQSNETYAHAVGASLFATLAAKKYGWKSLRTQSKVAIAGLVHDVGKKEIDPAILKKPRIDLSAEEVKILETHPLRGFEILSNVRGIPEEIAQVALQHHEDCLGTGYPSRLTKNHIIPIARLMRVVDEFCQFLIPNPGDAPISPRDALRKLLQAAQNRLDIDFVTALAAVFTIDQML